MTRDGSAARKPLGNAVPRAIGTSPKIVPGSRSPSVRSIPSTSLTTSIRPASTAKSARSLAFVNGVLARRRVCGERRQGRRALQGPAGRQKIEVVKRSTGSSACSASGFPGDDIRRGADHARPPFPSGFRAPSHRASCGSSCPRVLHVAAAATEVAEGGALARERIGGLQGVAAEPPKPRVLWPSAGIRRCRSAPVPGAQPDSRSTGDARRESRGRRLGRRLPTDSDWPALRARTET